MEKLDNCPVCKGRIFIDFLICKDHLFSAEDFKIVQCTACGLRFTNPRPDETSILRYYDSDEYISHNAKKNTILNKIYKTVRNYAIRKKFDLVKKHSLGVSLLDIGCGTGEFLHYCNRKNFLTTGIEPNIKARNSAIENYSLDIFDENHLHSLPPSSFDVITMWHVLEHVHKLQGRLEKIRSLLKPEGALFIAVPNCSSWDAEKYKEFWAAYDLPRHLYHFTPESMSETCRRNNFQIKKIIPMKFDAFYISLLSEKYSTGKPNSIKAMINGFKSNFSAIKNQNNYSSLIYICTIGQNLK